MKIEHDYTKEKFWRQLFRNIYYGKLKKMKLLVNFIAKPSVLPGKKNYYRREEEWTDQSTDEIHSQGYREAKGLHDSIVWSGIPIYARFFNFEEFAIEEIFPTKKDTAETLNDAMLSDSDEKFKRGLAKASIGAAADWQKIALILALGVGAVIISKMLGLW